jgi:hypothetical protein
LPVATVRQGEGRQYFIRISGRPGIDVVEASEHQPPVHRSFATRALRQLLEDGLEVSLIDDA